jgi:hypothetical protein
MYLRRGDSPEGGENDPTTPVEDGFVAVPMVEAATISILGAEIPVAAARAVSVAGLLIALSFGATVVVPYLRARDRGEAGRVLAEFDGMLVSVTEPPASGETVEVRAFEDLARLSERTGRMILHCAVGPEHHFYLQDGVLTYHLCLMDAPPPAKDGGEA